MIRAKNLTKKFGGLTAVNNVSLSVAKGEVLGFLGPNGAGKTTTMKMLTGFLVPSSGSVELCDIDLKNDLKRAQAKVGYLPEGAPLFSEMTPLSFLIFIANVRGLQGKKKIDAIAKTIKEMGLESVMNQQIETLSKGFCRRLGLAQALLHNPDILILDEPTDGLDPNQKHEMRMLIRSIANDKAIIISTHILEEVESMCDRVIVIANAKLVANGTPDELKAKSRYHNAVILKIAKKDKGKISKALKTLPEVDGIEVEEVENDIRLTVLSKQGFSALESVQDLVKKKNFLIYEFFLDSGRLEDVFRQLTTRNGRAA